MTFLRRPRGPSGFWEDAPQAGGPGYFCVLDDPEPEDG